MQDESRWKQLGKIVGEDNLILDTARLNGRWPGAPPKAIVRPADPEQVCEILRLAHSERLTVAPSGSLTKQCLGGIPRQIDLLLSLERMNRVTDYQPADLTVTVEAGVRMANLEAALQRENQILPLDAPFSAEATVGGVIATNGSGPRRLAYGTARDMVLGPIRKRHRCVVPSQEHGAGGRCLIERSERKVAGGACGHDGETYGVRRGCAAGENVVRARAVACGRRVIKPRLQVRDVRGQAVIGR